MCGTAAEVSAVNSVDDRADPVPRPDDHGHRRGVRQGRPRPGRPVQGLGASMSTDARADASRCPSAVEIFDTTLRDGAQFEGISLTVEDKLRIAEQLDCLGVALDRGRLAAGQPEGRGVLPARRHRAAARRRRRWWPSARPGGRRARSTTTPRCATSSRRARRTVCIVGKSWDFHVTEALRHHARRGRGHGGRLGRVPEGGTGCGCSSTPSTSSTATRPTPSSPCGCSRRRSLNGADCLVLCDTNGGSLPHEVERIVGEVVATSATTSIVGIHTPQRHRLRGGQLAGRGARRRHARCRARSTGYGERTGNCNLTTVIPNLTLKMGVRTLPEGRLERLTAVSHHVAELVNLPLQPAGAVRRHRRRSPTRPACTSRPSPRREDAYEHVDPELGRQRHPLRRVASWPAGPTHRDEGRGARRRPRRRRRRPA